MSLLPAAASTVVAAAFLAAATLKGVGWALGDELTPLHMVSATIEVALAVAITLAPGRQVALFGALAFLLATGAYGLARATAVSGLAGPCGCLGRALPLRAWHQLVLTGVLLFFTGLALLSSESSTRRSS